MNAFPTNARILHAAALAIALVALINSASAAALFTENFSGSSGPNLTLGTGYGSPTTTFTNAFTITSGNDSRIYLGTNDTDYSSINFIFEATVSMTASTSAWGYVFFGMGNSDATGAFGEPGNPSILAAIDPVGALYGRDNGGGGSTSIDDPTSGTHRLRMTWNTANNQGLFELDLDYTGTFLMDASIAVAGGDNGFTSLNSRLVLGGGNGISFDDVSVTAVPEPAGLLLACCGIAGLIRFRRCRRIGK